jgi:peptidoglycan-associated lipoprotein
MMPRVLRNALGLLALVGAVPAAAQPLIVSIETLRAEFAVQSGTDKVYFAGDGFGLDAPAQATLGAQARWLRLHPEVAVRIEGHADDRTPRDEALATGERRAVAVRDFLLLQGVPAAQISVLSWGKERPVNSGGGEMSLALNRRAVTVLLPR